MRSAKRGASYTHTQLHTIAHIPMKRVPVCPVQMAEVLIIYEIFPSVLDHFFFVLFFRFGCPLWSRRMLEENHLPFPSCAALWFDLKFQFGVDLWGTQCYEPLERFTSFFFLRLSNGFSWRPFQFAICVFYYWIFLKPILGLSLRDMVLTG